jgi:hypothetical protein
VFVVILLISYKDLIFRFTYASFVDLRSDVYADDLSNIFTNSSGYTRYIANIFAVFSAGSYIMILFFFQSVCFMRKSYFFNIIILLSSLSVILLSILNIDRSTTFYWILIFYLVFVFYKPFIIGKQVKFIRNVIFIFGGLLMVYFISVSISRFSEFNGGTNGGIISYSGQPFINFCNFFDNFTTPKVSFHRIFPLTYYILQLTPDNWDQFVYSKTGTVIGVFFSSVGLLIVDAGIVYDIIFWVLFYIFVSFFLRRKYQNFISFDKLIIFFLFAIIPQVGAIAYFYTQFGRTIFLIQFLILSYYFKNFRVKNK